jgi:uncharacterized repeat protein (TIGR01451 family)
VQSTDLITWTNFTYLVDDDPGGVIGSGVAVLKEPDGITPIAIDGQYWMVYFRGGNPGTMYMASTPASGDLGTWTFASSWSLPPTAGGFDASGLWTPSFIRFGDMYYIYYQGQSSGSVWETGYARASATVGGNPVPPNSGSITWSKSDTNGDGIPDSVLKRGPGGSWDSTEAIDPMVRQFSDGVYYLFYTGNQNNGYATAPAPEGPWTKLGQGVSARWTTRSGTPTVSGGVLTLNAGAGITSVSTFLYQVVGYRANFGVGSGLQWGGFIDGSTGPRTMVGSVNGEPTRLYLKNYLTSEATALLCDGICRGAFHEYEVLWRSGNSLARMDHGAASASLSTQVPTGVLPVELYSYTPGGAPVSVDWVYVRQYRYPEPGTELGAEQGMVDLRVTKTGEPDPVRVGAPLTYTIVVTNQGDVPVSGVVVTDTLPVGTFLVTVDPGQGSCQGTGEVVCEVGEVVDTLGITLVITSEVDGEITNTVEVGSSSHELTPEDNVATEVTTILPSADLSVSQVDDPDPVLSGHLLTYNLSVHNNGLSGSTGITLTDILPASVVFISAEPSMYCAQTSPVVCNLPGLPASGDSSVQVVVIATLDGLITNTVTVSSATYDPNLANNSSEESTAVVTNADLSITQEDGPDPVLVEQGLTYTLTVYNDGPSIGANVRLTDTLPGDVTLISVTPEQGECVPGSVVTCELGNFTSGATVQVKVVVIPQAEGNVANTVDVAMDTPEDNLVNNTSTEVTTVLPMSADLDITYTAPLTVTAGKRLTYTAQVVNWGPSRAISPSVTINLPTEVSFLVSTPGAPVCTEAGGVVTCQLAELAKGDSLDIDILVQVASSVPYGSQISSQAAVTSAVADPVSANNNDDAPTTVYTQADLEVGVIDTPDPVAPGTILTYTLVITNYGPSDAIVLSLTDTLPSEVNYSRAIPDVCDLKPYTRFVLCEPSDLAAGQVTQIKLVVNVRLGVDLPIQNQVSLSALTPDPVLNNNTGNETTTIDATPPTLNWLAPVGNDQVYVVLPIPGLVITLTVSAFDDSGIDHVRFTRWDHVREVWVDLCVDSEGSTGEYECTWVLDNPLELPNGANAIYAYAYDTAGNWIRRRILIYNGDVVVLLPVIMR